MSSTMERPPAIDRRIAARRQTVREAGARRRLKWLLVLLGLAGAGALIAWLLFQSSVLAISKITVDGQHRSDGEAIVAASGVVTGMPTVEVPAADLETALLADPWVAAADVIVRWPGTVEVTIVEYEPAAWVGSGEQWALAAPGGAVVEIAAAIPDEAPRIEVGAPSTHAGASFTSLATLGALEFVRALPATLVRGAIVEGDDEGLRAVIGGFAVDLGYPSDMSAKAAAVVALIGAESVPPGSLISVVSPNRPAILPPASVTAEGEVTPGDPPPAADGTGDDSE